MRNPPVKQIQEKLLIMRHAIGIIIGGSSNLQTLGSSSLPMLVVLLKPKNLKSKSDEPFSPQPRSES